jgi:hypothetical protein
VVSETSRDGARRCETDTGNRPAPEPAFEPTTCTCLGQDSSPNPVGYATCLNLGPERCAMTAASLMSDAPRWRGVAPEERRSAMAQVSSVRIYPSMRRKVTRWAEEYATAEQRRELARILLDGLDQQ